MEKVDKSKIFTENRKEYRNFYYKSFKSILNDFDIELIFEYQIDKKIDFRHILKIKKNEIFKNSIDFKKYEKIISMIGLVEAINYYKIFCTENFVVEVDNLSEEEKEWWKKLYYKGLSELLYLNSINISMEKFVKFNSTGEYVEKANIDNLEGNLVLVGGGKDSNTTLELLKEEKNKIMIVNPRSASLESAKIAGYDEKDIIIVEREIDKRIFEYNESNNFLNGHIPFSAVISFVSTLVAAMIGYKNVITSNENSANEETAKGANHQYSKTYEYEKDVRDYLSNYVFSNEVVNYYSILRPLYEIQIMKLFSKHEKYFDVFKSCNVGSKIIDKKEAWCGNCPKCLFVYILMLAFVEKDKVIKTFGKDMLDDKEMINDFDKLIGKADEKPFECIGTKEEVNASMSIIIDKYQDSFLIDYYKNECKEYHISKEKIEELLVSFNNDNFLYEKDINNIKRELGVL